MTFKFNKLALLTMLPFIASTGASEHSWQFQTDVSTPITSSVNVSEDFSETNVTPDLSYRGSWKYRYGYIHQISSQWEDSKALFTQNIVKDFTLQTTIELKSTVNSGSAGVIFRANNLDSGNHRVKGYYLGISKSNNLILSYLDGNNRVLPIHLEPFHFEKATKYKLKIEVIDKQLRVFVDDQFVFTQQIQDIEGAIGLRTDKTSAVYSDLKVVENSQTVIEYTTSNKYSDYFGEWNVVDDELIQSNARVGIWGKKIVLDNKPVDNFTLEVDVTPRNSWHWKSDSGVIFRASDLGVGLDQLKGYYVGIGRNNKLIMGKHDNNWQEIASADLPYVKGKTYHLKVVAIDNIFKIYVDGALTLEVNDGRFASGLVGFRTHGVQTAYDNLSIDGEITTKETREIHDNPYLLAYFKGNSLSQEKMWYAKSYDALNFTPLNDDQYVFDANDYNIRLRDPFIQKVVIDGVETFHLVHTKAGAFITGFYHWQSTDLKNWTGGFIDIMKDTGAPNAWAPEFFYEQETGKYYTFWTSRTPRQPGEKGDDGWTDKIWYSVTTDWVNFTKPEVYFYPGVDVIDANIVKDDDGVYQMVYKTEFGPAINRHLRRATSTSLDPAIDKFEGYERLLPSVSYVEGPQQFTAKVNGDEKEYLYYDYFFWGRWGVAEKHGDGSYTQLNLTDTKLPTGARHGSIINISWSQLSDLAGAGQQTGLVTKLEQRGDEFYFELDGQYNHLPSCSETSGWLMTSNSSSGQALYTQLQDAQNIGLAVSVYGQGRCLYGDGGAETPGNVTVN
ncbi:family 16 glycoside hydrolase [Shewanella gaetbuli]|uniref:DUF1080 domain-containing protein n=1 Tax=Shewanella gaetbuli TaxID=220752 RepID=A0A9X1ZUA9_9GAMM|nr:family 16 glycoside hydrolase [Shewanella gaetbuli]MCL1142386.1 DUF1080 domain-containing protein [Shewanella gaetbuli]